METRVFKNKIPLRQIIFEYIDEAGLDRSKYRRLFPIAIRGAYELGSDIFLAPKTAKLEVRSNMTAELPEDLIKLVKLGTVDTNGRFVSLTHDDSMIVSDDSYINRQIANGASDGSYYFLMDMFSYNGLYYELGRSSERITDGMYNIDYDNNIVVLNSDFSGSYIMAVYIAAPCDDDFLIPHYVREAMIAWLRWKDVRFNDTGRISDKRDARFEYFNERRRARNRKNPLNLDEAMDIELNGIKLSVKG